MGIISSALAAAGDAGVQSMDQRLKIMGQQQLDESRSDLETQKQKALIDYQRDSQLQAENLRRQGVQERVGTAQAGVVDKAMADKYAQSDAAAAAAAAGQTSAPLTPDQQAAIDQSKTIDKQALAADPHTYIKAAMASGDIDPKEVAALVQQADAFKNQQAIQESGFVHSDKSQAAQFAHADTSQRAAQGFQASESSKTREMEEKRMKAMYGDPGAITEAEKQNWVRLYVNNGGVPRSSPPVVQRNVGTWVAQMGITPDDISSGRAQAKYDQAAATTAGHRAGSMAGVEAAMPALADNALALSQKLDQGKFVPLNKLEQIADSQISDPDLAAFKVAHQALASEYQQVIARGGTNVTALKEAMHVLNLANGPDAYAAAVNQVKREVAINVDAMNKVRASMGGVHGGKPAGPSMVSNPVAPTNGVLTYDPATGTFH